MGDHHEQPPAYEEAVPSSQCFEKGVGYVAVEASQHCAYLLRSDGIIDRTTRSGLIQKQMISHEPHKYVGVSSGHRAAYALRSDGSVMRTTSGGHVDGVKSERRPPAGCRYIGVSSGIYASYYVRSDGAVDRATSGGRVSSELKPAKWPQVGYVAASSGMHYSFLLKSDGGVDKIKGGKLNEEMTAHEAPPGVCYIALADQVELQNDKNTYGNPAMYLIRSDGKADRMTIGLMAGSVSTLSPSPGTKFISGASGVHCSYLIQDDGVALRIKGGKVTHSFRPSAGNAKYINASCGDNPSYLLRSDGIVDRRTTGGQISREMYPPSAEEVAANQAWCAIQ